MRLHGDGDCDESGCSGKKRCSALPSAFLDPKPSWDKLCQSAGCDRPPWAENRPLAEIRSKPDGAKSTKYLTFS